MVGLDFVDYFSWKKERFFYSWYCQITDGNIPFLTHIWVDIVCPGTTIALADSGSSNPGSPCRLPKLYIIPIHVAFCFGP